MLRLPMIVTTDERNGVITGIADCPGKHIFAGDLAEFMVAQLTDPKYWRKAPFVASRS
jgi:hypothetical protein